MGFIRAGHGGSKRHEVVIEVPPLDEIGHEASNAGQTAQGLAVAKRTGRPFEAGNASAKNRKPELCRLGVNLDKCDPSYRAAMKRGQRYVAHRKREFAVAGGGYVSAGVCAILASAGRAQASAALLSEIAGTLLGSSNAKEKRRGADLLVMSSRLGSEARQSEIAAHALHARETAARPSESDDMTWLTGTTKPTSKPADNSLNSPGGFPVPPCASPSRKERELSADFGAVDDVAEEPSK